MSYWFDERDNSSLIRLGNQLASECEEPVKSKLAEFSAMISQPFEQEDIDQESTPDDEIYIPVPTTESRTEDEFWSDIDKVVLEAGQDKFYYRDYSGLYEVARNRAFLQGFDEVSAGLEILICMHSRWVFGKSEGFVQLPSEFQELDWESVAIELFNILLQSFSNEVLVGALEGLHLFVGQNPDVIGQLFDSLHQEWPRRWLLNLSEVWATLFPDVIQKYQAKYIEATKIGNFDMRLQSWIVLAKNSMALSEPILPFPLESTAKLSPDDIARAEKKLLDIPPLVHGNMIYADRHRTSKRVIDYFRAFGFDFTRLEGVVANNLATYTSPLSTRDLGARRWDDTFSSNADAENAVGAAIAAALSSKNFSQDSISQLCHAFLANDDPWILRSRPTRVADADTWASEQYKYDTEYANTDREAQLSKTIRNCSIDNGWKPFSAKLVEFSWEYDFRLNYWFELDSHHDYFLAKSVPRTCPGGRAFIWSVGQPVELRPNGNVSGLFVGGRFRLPHSAFEIRPPGWWVDVGWHQKDDEPTLWLNRNGEPVLRYERLHGVTDSRSNGHRQPVLSGWFIKPSELAAINALLGDWKERHSFDATRTRDS